LAGSGYDEWDAIYRRFPLQALPWERGKPREALVVLIDRGLIEKGKALDPCCGAGTNSLFLAQKGFDVTAMDISPRALRYAKEKAAAAGVSSIRFLAGNFMELPFGEGQFDFVLDSGCFHHVRVGDRDAYIKGIRRVLKRGGLYLLICFSDENGPGWNHFTREDLVRLFSPHLDMLEINHAGSIEGDGVVRYFHNALMQKAPPPM
jgi:ubiquinone/menaquinone biosynthesis C-methylase UbiE